MAQKRKKKATTRSKVRKSAQRRKPAAKPFTGGLEDGGDRDLNHGGLEGMGNQEGETTGRMLVTFVDQSPASIRSSLASLKTRAGIARVCRAADFAVESFDVDQAESADATVLDELGIAIVRGDPDQIQSVAAMGTGDAENMIMEPEYMNYALGLEPEPMAPSEEDPMSGTGGSITISTDYLRGYQQAVESFVASVAEGTAEAEGAVAALQDTSFATWGLRVTRALHSRLSGKGVRVAVLDTGLDLRHPDFRGRAIRDQSFISGQSVQDGHGHGTHCIGTACGSRSPGVGPRYGVAHEAEIYAGKVLSDQGRGGDGAILAGINWALRNRCRVVSMSLGRPTRMFEPPMRAYETAARRALRAGTLIIAAAGNESNRPSVVRPVGSPANCPSIAAVAALDSNLRIASFSNRGINPNGGEVNLAGPGVAVLSSWPMPRRTRSISGTSMATLSTAVGFRG